MNATKTSTQDVIRKKIRDILPELKRQLAEYIAIPSISREFGGEMREMDRALNWVEAYMRKLDFSVQRIYQGSGAFLIGRNKHHSDRPSVLLYGHADVYPVAGQDWATDPWTLADCKDHYGLSAWRGRGTADNKGQTLAVLAALRLLSPEIPVNVTMLLESQEETGSPDLEAFLDTHRDLLKSDLLLGTDGFRHFSRLPTIFLGFRGCVRITLTCPGAGRDIHSGNFGGVVPNPTARLANGLSTLFDPDGNCLLPGFYYVEIPENIRSVLSLIPNPENYFRNKLGLKNFAGDASLTLNERLYALPTLTITGVSSGKADSGPRNVIPGDAVAYVDCRSVPGQDWRRVPEMIREALDEAGHRGIEIESHCLYEPSRTDPSNFWVQRVVHSLTDCHEGDLCVLPNSGASLGNNFFQDLLGLPTIWFPIAQPDNNQHGADEHLSLKEFSEGILSLYWILTDLGKAKK